MIVEYQMSLVWKTGHYHHGFEKTVKIPHIRLNSTKKIVYLHVSKRIAFICAGSALHNFYAIMDKKEPVYFSKTIAILLVGFAIYWLLVHAFS